MEAQLSEQAALQAIKEILTLTFKPMVMEMLPPTQISLQELKLQMPKVHHNLVVLHLHLQVLQTPRDKPQLKLQLSALQLVLAQLQPLKEVNHLTFKVDHQQGALHQDQAAPQKQMVRLILLFQQMETEAVVQAQ